MEWVSGSDRPRLFQCRDGTLLLTGSFWGGRTCPALINARLGHWAVFSLVLSGAEKWKCWWWAFAFRQQSFGREVGCGREERWGLRRRAEKEEKEEEEGVRIVGTRSLGDHSPGSPSVWQLWKFIAIDFVISSLSIGSTWAHWWIARKLFLQSCFFKSAPPPRTTSRELSCPLFLPICWDVSISLFFLFFPLFFSSLLQNIQLFLVQIRFIAKMCMFVSVKNGTRYWFDL